VGDVLHAIGIRWQLVLVQLVGFLIVFGILKTLLFDRIHKVLEDRAAEEEHRRLAIGSARHTLDAARARLKTRESEVEKQAYERTQAEVRAGLKVKADLVSQATDQARREVTGAREEFSKARDRALAGIQADVAELALFVASQVAGRKLDGAGQHRQRATREVEALLAARGKRPLEGGAA